MQFETRHHEFHRALLAACGSPRLLALFEQLYAETQRYRLPSFRGEGKMTSGRDLSAEHSHIMEAALARKIDVSVRLLQEHYNRTVADIVAQETDAGQAGLPTFAQHEKSPAAQLPDFSEMQRRQLISWI